MAQPNYTYDDFLSYLPGAGLTESDFSKEDLAMAKANPTAGVYLLEAKADWKNAKTDDERAMANARANSAPQFRDTGWQVVARKSVGIKLKDYWFRAAAKHFYESHSRPAKGAGRHSPSLSRPAQDRRDRISDDFLHIKRN